MRPYLTIISFVLLICAVSSRYIETSSEDETSSEIDQDSVRRDFRKAVLLARIRGLLNSENEDTRSQLVEGERDLSENESGDSEEGVRKKRQIDDADSGNVDNDAADSEDVDNDAADSENIDNNDVENNDNEEKTVESNSDENEENDGSYSDNDGATNNVEKDDEESGAKEQETQDEQKSHFVFEDENDDENFNEPNDAETDESLDEEK